MSDPTDYHRKLAEAVWGKYYSKRDLAAALASEGVVDPEVYKYQQMQQHNTNVANEELGREVERLEAEKYNSSSTTMVETVRQAVAAERERAAKIAEGSLSWCMTAGETEASAIAAAIRAEKERGDE